MIERSSELELRPATAADVPAISALLSPLFEEFIAPAYSEEGCATFRAYIEPNALMARLADDHSGWIAEIGGELVGYIERSGAHINLFFIRADRQRQGLSRQLLDAALAGTGFARVTIHASDYAVPIFHRLGFRPTAPRRAETGIIHTPMASDRAVQVRIYGRVQGVWYRAWTEQTATKLGLAGWVRNRADGSVEALFVGSPAAIEAMIAWCREGPRAARVDDVVRQHPVDLSAAQAGTTGFRQLPTL